jgi:TetR/AcrR family transcriptional regulator, tetracycline repressor protein
MAITQDDIVAAAVTLLDEGGLAGFTLRRLAERLDIRAPTLYWHVRNKRELLDLVADAIVGEALAEWQEPRPGQPWWDWLAGRSRALRVVLLAHRDSALVLAGNRPTPRLAADIERRLTVLVKAGFQPAEALLGIMSLQSFVVGEVLDSQGEAHRQGEVTSGEAHGPDPGAITGANLAEGHYPVLRAAAGRLQSSDQRFEYGLSLIITGLRTRLEPPR